MPPILTAESADVIARNVRALRLASGLEVLPENPPAHLYLGDLHLLDYFARVAEGELSLEVPFLGRLARLVRLPERQTPLYISERVATRAREVLTITLPDGAKAIDLGQPVKIDDPRLKITANDKMVKGKLILTREVAVPASRIQPADYAAFKEMVLRGDQALNRKVRIQL